MKTNTQKKNQNVCVEKCQCQWIFRLCEISNTANSVLSQLSLTPVDSKFIQTKEKREIAQKMLVKISGQSIKFVVKN